MISPSGHVIQKHKRRIATSGPFRRPRITPLACIGIDAGIALASLFCPCAVGLAERLRLGLTRKCELARLICCMCCSFCRWSHDVSREGITGRDPSLHCIPIQRYRHAFSVQSLKRGQFERAFMQMLRGAEGIGSADQSEWNVVVMFQHNVRDDATNSLLH